MLKILQTNSKFLNDRFLFNNFYFGMIAISDWKPGLNHFYLLEPDSFFHWLRKDLTVSDLKPQLNHFIHLNMIVPIRIWNRDSFRFLLTWTIYHWSWFETRVKLFYLLEHECVDSDLMTESRFDLQHCFLLLFFLIVVH